MPSDLASELKAIAPHPAESPDPHLLWRLGVRRKRRARMVRAAGAVVALTVAATVIVSTRSATEKVRSVPAVTTPSTTAETTPSTAAASIVPITPGPPPLTVLPFGVTKGPASLRYAASDVQSTPTAPKAGQVVLRYHLYLSYLSIQPGRTGEITAEALTTDGQLAVEISCPSASPQCTKILPPTGPASSTSPLAVVVRTTDVALTEGTHDLVMTARWDDGTSERIVTAFLVTAPPSADISRQVIASTGAPRLAQTVVGTGHFSYHLTSAFGSIWVVSKNSQTVTRIDAVTGQLLATIALPSGFSDRVTATDDAVYVSGAANSLGDATVTRIDPTTNSTSSIDVGGDSWTVFANHNDLWAAGPGGVSHIDSAGTITKIAVPKAPWVDGGVAGGLVWVVSQNRSKSRLVAIDGSTGAVRFDVANIYDPALPDAYPVRLVADERSVVVGIDTGAQHGQVLIVDPASGTITNRLALRARPEGIVLTDRYIWTGGAIIDRTTLQVIDVHLGFSLARGPDGSIWATSGVSGSESAEGVALRWTPGDYHG